MAGFTDAYENTVLDLAYADTDYVAYSENGSSESANLARTAITAWAAAGSGTKNPTAALTSAAASGAATISHFAIYSTITGGTQKTDWTALTASKTLASGDKLSWAAADLDMTLD